ncbi:hypothetical protein VTJ04DRAFT_2343 [Mycothermus thermophilus]|uniref:uncharacterized protein n=1 Tax=Humicola insolens TaxID=85995 RepID=UPI003742A376
MTNPIHQTASLLHSSSFFLLRTREQQQNQTNMFVVSTQAASSPPSGQRSQLERPRIYKVGRFSEPQPASRANKPALFVVLHATSSFRPFHSYLPPSLILPPDHPTTLARKKSLHYLTRISQKQSLGQPRKREEEEEEKAFQPSLLPPPPPLHLLACPCIEQKNPTIAVGSSKKTKHNAMPHTTIIIKTKPTRPSFYHPALALIDPPIPSIQPRRGARASQSS